MPDAEARDAYLYVEVPHPKGQVIRGKSPPWSEAVAILTLIREGSPDALAQARARFLAATGIDEALIADLSFGPFVDFCSRFFWALPPGTTPAPGPPAASPAASSSS